MVHVRQDSSKNSRIWNQYQLSDRARVKLLSVIFAMVVAVTDLTYARTAHGMNVRIDPWNVQCEDFITESGNNLSWRSMIEIENCDRIQRIARIARLYDRNDEPEFYFERIPADKMPASVRVDVPLLRVVFPQRMFFDTSKSELRPEAREVISIIADSLRKDVPDVTLFVAGHTDPRGGWQFNQNLSIDRANRVAEEIVGQGVRLTNIWRIGFGADMPLVPNTDEHGMAVNRRVEFLIAGKTEAVSAWLADMQLENLCQGESASETNKCRQELHFQQSYVAQTVNPAADEVPFSADSELGAELDPEHADKDVEIAPSDASTRNDTIGIGNERKSISLTSTRTIVINPINRTATPSYGAGE